MDINERVVRKHDPAVVRIVDSATFVTAYIFDDKKQSWVQKTFPFFRP